MAEAFNPRVPIRLTWSPELGEILTVVHAVISRGFPSNTYLAARTLLLAVQEGKALTVEDVVYRIHRDDEPLGGWIDFDFNKWSGYVMQIVTALQEHLPELVNDARMGRAVSFLKQ